MPQPNTIGSELNNNIETLLTSGLQYAHNDNSLDALEQDAKKLAKVSSSDGYLALAAISMLRGNFSEMRSRYEIARNQGLSAGQRINYVTTLSHAGFFSEAAAIVKNAADNYSAPFFAFIKAALCFQFKTSLEIFDKAMSQNLTPPEGFITTRNTFADVSRIVDIDDSDLARLADLAGEVMRERHVYFKTFPTLKFCTNDAGEDFVVASFLVPVSFEDASEMTLSFAEKMFTRGLENEKFLIRFFGQA